MKLTVEINALNAAFFSAGRDSALDDALARNAEVVRILRNLATALEDGRGSGELRDINGNKVGFARWE